MSRPPQFCEDCDVTLDLHNGEDSCDYAEHKARMVDVFNQFIWNVVGGPR